MTTLNSYATLAEFKAYRVARGQSASIDTADDEVIEQLLKKSSNHIESKTGRHFVPFVETRYFSVPDALSIDARELRLDNDLLEIISITNGDGTTIPSTEYTVRPRNRTPYYAVRLIDNSTYYWATDGAGDSHDVIAINGVWGFHNHYADAWLLGSTAAEAMDATETAYDVTSGTLFKTGNIIRFDNELGYISSISSNTMTISRGINNSTAATHETGINIYIWQAMEEARGASLEIADNAYRRRFGDPASTSAVTITAAGVVLSPKDIPAMAVDFISTYRNIT